MMPDHTNTRPHTNSHALAAVAPSALVSPGSHDSPGALLRRAGAHIGTRTGTPFATLFGTRLGVATLLLIAGFAQLPAPARANLDAARTVPDPAALRDQGPQTTQGAQAAQAALETVGTIDAVTVYRGQALVTRLVDAGTAPGTREIRVTNLPEFINPASLYAEADDGVQVRSVSYQVRPLASDARPEVSQLEDGIRELGDLIAQTRARQSVLEWKKVYFDNLEKYLSGTAVVENNKGVLNAETITKMSEYIIAQRQRHAEETTKAAVELRTQTDQLQQLQRRLAVIAAKTSRSSRDAVIFVNIDAKRPTPAAVRLYYIVDRATWSPSYILRGDGQRVLVEYQAQVQQTSGEDWPSVKMTLSTATPSLVAAAPRLTPLPLTLSAAVDKSLEESSRGRSYADARRQLETAQRQIVENRGNSNINFASAPSQPPAGAPISGSSAGVATPMADVALNSVRADIDLNDAASRAQLLDLLTTERVERLSKSAIASGSTPAPGALRPDESVSVTYALPQRTSLPSRPDQQLIQIARVDAPATYAKIATPLLTTHVFNEATATNVGTTVLLAGPSASYLAGEFVGRGLVPTTAAGQQLVVGLGIDTSLRTSRELVERTETIQGGNRIVDFTYRLSVENFGTADADVRLLDRMPLSKGNDIRVTLVSPGSELSKDATYEAGDKKQNILRWDVKFPAGATGAKALAIEYKVRIEHDKQMFVSDARR